MIVPTTTRSEHVEHREFVSWFKKTFSPVEIASFPNGDDRSPAAALRMKLEGVNPGMPDLFVMEWNLYIEMKKIGGTLQAVQVAKHHYLRGRCKATVLTCYGFQDAKQQVLRFVENQGIIM